MSLPSSELVPEAQESLLKVHPQVLEMFQRYMIEYHVSQGFYSNADHNLMGLVIEEAVYAPLYYGYGGKDSAAPERSPEGQRTQMARMIEETMVERGPGSVLVLFKAAPEVTRGAWRLRRTATNWCGRMTWSTCSNGSRRSSRPP